ncbi:MAG: InlB B-repeat-containing protein [Christensenellales bacterium]
MTFNANEGTVTPAEKRCITIRLRGTAYADAQSYTRLGWFTQSDSGAEVMANTKVTTGNHMLYAHWTQNVYREIRRKPKER